MQCQLECRDITIPDDNFRSSAGGGVVDSTGAVGGALLITVVFVCGFGVLEDPTVIMVDEPSV